MTNDEFDDREPAGNGRLLLWLGLGCLGFAAVICAVLGVGGYMLYTTVKERLVAEGIVDAPPPAEYGTLPGEVFDRENMPQPPLNLAAPAAPAAELDQLDLTQVEPPDLRSLAEQYYNHQLFQAAIQCQYQSVIRADTGRYNLACFYARAGDIAGALYWLQECARLEDSNAAWASRDGDLVAVRKDPRWPELLNYLRAYQKYWETSEHSETALVLPHEMPADRTLPLFIGLHGLGHRAQGFVDPAMYQPLADEMGVAFLAVSGTLPRGKHSFVWSEDLSRDLKRIDAALAEVADRITPAEGKVVLFGFSQGAMLAAELAARHPDRFAGAIVLSPGSQTDVQTAAENYPLEKMRRLGIVVVCGDGEHPQTIERTKHYTNFFTSVEARVWSKIYPGMNTHSLPPDYREKLPVWGKFILDPQAPVPAF